MLKKISPFLLSLSSGVLLSLAWYWHFTILIFFALIPLLITENKLTSEGKRNNLKLFGLAYLTFFTWNILVTWWVVYASFGGACVAFVLNSLFMALVFVAYSRIKNRLQKSWGHWLLIPLWLAWEHWHTLWDLTWTWLTIGNVFAFNHNWVQWYEFTGTSGGTCWALFANILIFKTIKNNSTLKLISIPVIKIAATIIVPIFISYLIFVLRKNSFDTRNGVKTVVVQPNIDPYNDKFNWDFQYQFSKTMRLLKGKITSKTAYLVLPETFITENLDEATLNQSQEIRWFRDSILTEFPKLKIITGANTYILYNYEGQSSTARKDEKGIYYDAFNTVLQIDSANLDIYHKSKLVPGVERMPFPALLKPLESLAINMGGTMGSLGTQSTRGVFENKRVGAIVAPVVCYESIFADYETEYVRMGANLIFIITNDGWWDNTPGFVQHLNYARLRAIENRRQIARCANTGISCFIDEFGNLEKETEWWKEASIEKNMRINNDLVFFSRFGDLLSYASLTCAALFFLWALWLRFKK
jgi:apolipoprotein N-acyltransferase